MQLLESLIGRARHDACVAQDKAIGVHVRRSNARTAANDEPEPTWEQIEAEAQAEVRAILRSRPVVRSLNAQDLKIARGIAQAFPLEGKRS